MHPITHKNGCINNGFWRASKAYLHPYCLHTRIGGNLASGNGQVNHKHVSTWTREIFAEISTCINHVLVSICGENLSILSMWMHATLCVRQRVGVHPTSIGGEIHVDACNRECPGLKTFSTGSCQGGLAASANSTYVG